MNGRLRLSLLVGCLGLAACLGCASYEDRAHEFRTAYYSGGLESAGTLLDTVAKNDRANATLLQLDRAMIDLAAGRPQSAEQHLRQVRDEFDALENAQAQAHARAAYSYLTDDESRAYAGEDYEKVLLRVLLAFSNLMHDGTDAEAYSLQVIDKQQQIIEAAQSEEGAENPKANYPRVAIAPYLRGVLREATHIDYDDAERSFATVVSWQPSFVTAQRDLQRATHGAHCAAGHGVLYVFAFVGRGPTKQEVEEMPSTVSLLIAGEILGALGNQTVPPNVAAIKVPQVVAQMNDVSAVRVDIDGSPRGITETVTDVTELAIQQYAAIYPQVIARAVARRCLKKGIVYGAKGAVQIEKGSALNLLVDLAGVAWEATESADTRCWGLLPDKLQVVRIELPVGEHRLTLRSILRSGQASQFGASQEISIADGRNTYALATFPSTKIVGEVLVKTQ